MVTLGVREVGARCRWLLEETVPYDPISEGTADIFKSINLGSLPSVNH